MSQSIREIKVEITKVTPMLQHSDSIDWADLMEEWKNDPDNKALSKAGDDRTPPWRWFGCLYSDDSEVGVITVPSDNIMSCLRAGAAEVPTGKGKSTFKSRSQSGIIIPQFHWPLLVNGKTISMKTIQEMKALKKFKQHVDAVRDLGFDLFVKRVAIGQTKHIRVRPRFDSWSTSGELTITDELITNDVMKRILDISGRYKGLGDWRPSSPKKPGPFGMFEARIVAG